MEEINIKGLEIKYEKVGEGSPLLILHGWGGSSGSWDKVRQSLSSDFEVIVPDLPGFGRTASPEQSWAVSDYVDFILKFTQKLGLDTFYLVGHSFGGSLAVKFTTEYPNRVKKLLLLDSAGIKPKPGFKAKVLNTIAQVGNFIFDIKLLNQFKDEAKDYFYLLIRNRDYGKANEVMKETMNNVFNYYNSSLKEKEGFLNDLEAVEVQTFVLWGQKDKVIPLKYGKVLNEKINNSEFKSIPGVGHSPNLEKPLKTAKLITGFFK